MSQSQPLILIVEDEPKLAEVLREYLTESNYNNHWIENGLEVLPWVKENTPDLILLDLMLPGKDGLSIFTELRRFSDIPVVMATAKVHEIERLLGLELGADDYICKPYSPREVVVRIKNILRRTNTIASQPSLCQIEIDESAMSIKLNGVLLDATPSEYRLLKQLTDNQNRVYSRDHLMDYIYDDNRVVTDRAVDSHIKNLRKKMVAVSEKCDLIKSVYGVGYKLELP